MKVDEIGLQKPTDGGRAAAEAYVQAVGWFLRPLERLFGSCVDEVE